MNFHLIDRCGSLPFQVGLLGKNIALSRAII